MKIWFGFVWGFFETECRKLNQLNKVSQLKMRAKPASIFVTFQWQYHSLSHSFLLQRLVGKSALLLLVFSV